MNRDKSFLLRRGPWFLACGFYLVTVYGSRFTKEKVSGPRRVALEARADESSGECVLKFFADALQFGARGFGVFAYERVPVRGNLDGGGWLAQVFRLLAARERFDAGRVEHPFGDEEIGRAHV